MITFTRRAEQAKALVESVPHEERDHILQRISEMPGMEDVVSHLGHHWGMKDYAAGQHNPVGDKF